MRVRPVGVWGSQVAVTPKVAGRSLEAFGHERGSLLALCSDDLPPFAHGVPLGRLHIRHRLPH